MSQRAMTLDEIREYFSHDTFATNCLGAHIDAFELGGETVVSMTVDPQRHSNAQGFVMGGVFTGLCDFALAVCSNANQVPCCSTDTSMQMMNRCRGERLVATATCVKDGRSLGFYQIDLRDELGTHVGRMSATTMRTPQVPSPFLVEE